MPTYKKMNRGDMSLREFSNRFNVSMSTASRMTSSSREAYLREVKKRHKVILLLRQEGLSYRKIAAKAGVSVGTVHYALAKTKSLETSQFDSPAIHV